MKDASLRRAALVVGLIFAIMVAVATSAHALDYEVQNDTVYVAEDVGLITKVYLPEREGSYPAVLIRTPYGTRNTDWVAEYLAPHGYAVVVQSVRGKNGSGGQFFPFAWEKGDGMATLDWVLKQPFCNGDVGLWGVSYLGYAANEIASTGHPAIKAVFALSGYGDLEPFITHGGSFHLMAHLPWFLMFQGGQSPPAEAWPQIFRTTPIADFFQGAAEPMAEMMSAPYDYSGFTMPYMHVSGWYDYIYVNTLGTYEAIQKQVPDAGEQRLIMGVWPHNNAMNGQSTAGDEDFGPQAAWGTKEVNNITRRWFDLHLKGKDDGLGSEPPVRLFIMGDNEWRTFDTWPPKAVETKAWYVDCEGNANSSQGSGSLSGTITDGKDSDQFTYDPENPVPTVGGANWHMAESNIGVKDQTDVATRPDVLVYTSDVLERPLTLVGPVKAVVYAATEGKDTDITAKLVEVRSDGYARNIVDGIIRASFQFGLDSTNWLEADRVYKYEVDMGATAITLDSGSRLRLEISSSNFPKYDRNPNTGVDAMFATEFVPVTQTVMHTEEYPTHVLLPVLDEPKRSQR